MIDLSVIRFIAITDNIRDGQSGLIARAAAAVHGGATCIQLRLKGVSARDLVSLAHELVRSVGVPVIVNDRADVAIAARAAGVHLGADDIPPAAVRAFAPPDFIIGASVGSEEEVHGSRGADYVGIGPVFGTRSKNDAGEAVGIAGFKHLASLAGIPAVAIGGITAANARAAIDGGAAGIAAIAAVMGADDPAAAAKEMAIAIGT